jgi:hypothetical protein
MKPTTKSKYKAADFIVIVLAWATSLALVYIAFLKFKRLLH